MKVGYRDEGATSTVAGCAARAHYREIQALCDALTYAARLEWGVALREARNDRFWEGAEYAYRGVLRALEQRSEEWTPLEAEMLGRIDWSKPKFVDPEQGP